MVAYLSEGYGPNRATSLSEDKYIPQPPKFGVLFEFVLGCKDQIFLLIYFFYLIKPAANSLWIFPVKRNTWWRLAGDV